MACVPVWTTARSETQQFTEPNYFCDSSHPERNKQTDPKSASGKTCWFALSWFECFRSITSGFCGLEWCCCWQQARFSSSGGYIVGACDQMILQGEASQVNPISWKAGKLSRVARSSLSAEIEAFSIAEEELMYVKLEWLELNGVEIPKWTQFLSFNRPQVSWWQMLTLSSMSCWKDHKTRVGMDLRRSTLFWTWCPYFND